MKFPCPAIIKDYSFHMNEVDIHDQLKCTNESDQKSRFWYYLRVFFGLMDSVIVNACIIYKNKVNEKMSIFHFKGILEESLTNRFSSQKQKFSSEEPQLTFELPQPLKEPAHIVQFTEKRQHCMYCFNNGKKDTK